MTIGEIATKARKLVGANTTSWSNSDLLVDLNVSLQETADIIHDSQDESDFQDARETDNFPIITTPLTTNRNYNFTQNDRLLKWKTLHVSYDGVNYYRATPIDSSEISSLAPSDETAHEAAIDGQFSKTAPRYDLKYNSLFLYPKADSTDVANGGEIMIECLKEINDFTLEELVTGTAIPGFDKPYHPILPYKMALLHIDGKDFANRKAIEDGANKWEAKLRRGYAKKVLDRDLAVKSLVVNYK